MSNSMGSVVEETAMESIADDSFAAAAPGVYISPWTPDSNASNHLTVFQHGLGVIPQSVLVLFSPDGDTVYPVMWPWDYNAGNPVTISMTSTNVILNIYSSTALHGAWSAATTQWTHYNNGYWKVIAKASA
ncbi:MAG TPA: hypothetical protein VG477_17200 [Thermoanaerobaculia bacterium]|nr:hypothetical protein [Thermoanaerobaculia bacterium]